MVSDSFGFLHLMIAIIFGMMIGFLITYFVIKIRSRTYRKIHDIPNILGRWECKWFDDTSESEKPKVEDIVEINKWTRHGEFVATGYQAQFNLAYPLTGEVDPSRVITLEYRAARYPYEPNRGVVCMLLSRDGETMEGLWFGRRSTGTLGGGKVVWRKR